MAQKEKYFKIGYVTKSHGLKGEVTVSLDPRSPDLKSLKSLFIEFRGQIVPHFLESVSVKGTKAFVKLEDVSTPEAAAALKGCSLFIPMSARPGLERGDFYSDEVLGFTVIDHENGVLGTIREVFESGSNRHLVLDYHEKEVLIPVNGPFITSVNKSKKKIEVELPEGFLEI